MVILSFGPIKSLFSFSLGETNKNYWKQLVKTKFVVWWFDVMNHAWASIASCSLCSTKCFRNISQFWLFVWNAELSGYWSYLSLGPRCVPSVFAGVWACISINATFIGITRDSDSFPLNVTVFHIKKNSRNYYILENYHLLS